MIFCTVIGAPVLIFSYFLSLLLGINAVNPKFIFNTNSLIGMISILVLSIGVITFILGIASAKLFFSSKVTNDSVYNN